MGNKHKFVKANSVRHWAILEILKSDQGLGCFKVKGDPDQTEHFIDCS